MVDSIVNAVLQISNVTGVKGKLEIGGFKSNREVATLKMGNQ